VTLTGVVSSLATTSGHTYSFQEKLYVKGTAARIYEYGEPDVFRFETMAVPDPVGHEVLVRNTVIGLNFVDIYYRRGTLPVPEFLTIIGDEAFGVVEGEDQRGIGISLFCQTRSLQLRRCPSNLVGRWRGERRGHEDRNHWSGQYR
jgi:hypothetical protein